MVLKSAFVAVVCTGLLALAGPATAAEDLKPGVSSAVPDSTDPDLDASVWPKLPPRKAHVAKTTEKPHVKRSAEPPRAAARTKLAKRHGNPLDAQARDTRIQVWPCKSGGICNWRRSSRPDQAGGE